MILKVKTLFSWYIGISRPKRIRIPTFPTGLRVRDDAEFPYGYGFWNFFLITGMVSVNIIYIYTYIRKCLSLFLSCFYSNKSKSLQPLDRGSPQYQNSPLGPVGPLKSGKCLAPVSAFPRSFPFFGWSGVDHSVDFHFIICALL